jgi:hypothetical protein
LQPAFSGADAAAFRVVADTCAGATLDSGEACTVTVTFRPARLGPHTATLQVPVEGEPDAPFESGLSGEGIPGVRLTPSILDFGTLLGLSGATQHVLVESVSGREMFSPLTRTEPVTGAFRRDSTIPDRCEGKLAPGATCRVGIRPRPGVTDEARLVFGSQMEMPPDPCRPTPAEKRPAAHPRREAEFRCPERRPAVRGEENAPAGPGWVISVPHTSTRTTHPP